MVEWRGKRGNAMFVLFDERGTSSIGIDARASEAVWLAAQDVAGNLRRLAGRTDGFEVRAGEADICVVLEAGEAESYTVDVSENGVRIVGADTLGAVYGLYAFATRVLGVEPTYRLTDVFPKTRESMAVECVRFASGKRPIRFRGWFLNDEDLLTEFKESGGVRHIDYKFYHTTMHTDVLDMILETALRLEINLMIPSSFVDIDNPDEEKLVEATCRRGLYISQHHVEPLGVSYFGAGNYIKKHGLAGEVSFISNRKVMEEIWAHYAKKWAKYRQQVIWQFGLRGRADEAVWKRDKSVPLSNEGRGAVISDAIRTQYEIVKRTLGNAPFLSTVTLWMEGAQLYGEGYLKLPEDTIAIFSDVGFDQMFGDDFYRAPRHAGREYGIYYHVAFYGRGPHLADTCNPLKMDFSYKEAARMGSLTYSIVNVSNVRPLHYAATANAALMNDPDGFDYDNFAQAFHTAHYGEAATIVKQLRDRFYLSCANIGETILKTLCDNDGFYYHDYGALPFVRYTADDGDLIMIGRRILKGQRIPYDIHDELTASASRFESLLADITAAESVIPTEALPYYRTFLKHQTEYMMLATKWCACCYELAAAASSDRPAIQARAVSCLERILRARKIEEQGSWQGWYKGDAKFNIPECLYMTRGC